MTDNNIRSFRAQPIGDEAEQYQPMLITCCCIEDAEKCVNNAAENPSLTPCGFWHRSGESINKHFKECDSGYCTNETHSSMVINPEANNWIRPTYGTEPAVLATLQAAWNDRCTRLIATYDIMWDHLETNVWGTEMPKFKYYMKRADHEVLLSYDPINNNTHNPQWLVDQMPFAEARQPMLLCHKECVCLPFTENIVQHFPLLCTLTGLQKNLWPGAIPCVTSTTKQYCNCGMVTVNWDTAHQHKKDCVTQEGRWNKLIKWKPTCRNAHGCRVTFQLPKVEGFAAEIMKQGLRMLGLPYNQEFTNRAHADGFTSIGHTASTTGRLTTNPETPQQQNPAVVVAVTGTPLAQQYRLARTRILHQAGERNVARRGLNMNEGAPGGGRRGAIVEPPPRLAIPPAEQHQNRWFHLRRNHVVSNNREVEVNARPLRTGTEADKAEYKRRQLNFMREP